MNFLSWVDYSVSPPLFVCPQCVSLCLRELYLHHLSLVWLLNSSPAQLCKETTFSNQLLPHQTPARSTLSAPPATLCPAPTSDIDFWARFRRHCTSTTLQEVWMSRARLWIRHRLCALPSGAGKLNVCFTTWNPRETQNGALSPSVSLFLCSSLNDVPEFFLLFLCVLCPGLHGGVEAVWLISVRRHLEVVLEDPFSSYTVYLKIYVFSHSNSLRRHFNLSENSLLQAFSEGSRTFWWCSMELRLILSLTWSTFGPGAIL